MKTSPTDAPESFVVHYDGGGILLIEGGAVVDLAGLAEGYSPGQRVKTVVVAPGDQVAIHWLELAEGLAPAQAAAAARLMLADASAESLADMHVAVGRPERGLTPVALAPLARMAEWVTSDPDMVIPSPLLLLPPAEGLVRRDAGSVPDYRGQAAAFSVEPELAALLAGDAPVAAIDEAAFQAGIFDALADPVLNLRQGPFAKRRQWKLERQRLRRVALFAIALAVLSLAVQVATIVSYTFAADRIEAEADALAVGAPRSQADARPAFGAAASVLFEAVRATPNVEVSRLDYRADGSLAATVMIDNPATLAALQARLEAGGLTVEPGEQRTAGGRPAADLIVRPA